VKAAAGAAPPLTAVPVPDEEGVRVFEPDVELPVTVLLAAGVAVPLVEVAEAAQVALVGTWTWTVSHS
jgi:hypothetical protein